MRATVGLPTLILFGSLAVLPAFAQPPGLAGTRWQGQIASPTSSNTPVALNIVNQNGSLAGTFTYDGYEEAVAITSSGPSRIQIKGTGFRDLRGGRSFSLDTFTVQISADGRQMTGNGRDANGGSSWFTLLKVDSTPAGPASDSLIRSLIGSNWDGAIIYNAKGGEPAKLRISQEGGALKGILTYDGFEETVSITLTAPFNITIRGLSVRDLSNQRRGFNLDSMQGQIAGDGHTMRGSGGGVQFDFRRVQ